jgi:excisionase family DNA binding protein
MQKQADRLQSFVTLQQAAKLLNLPGHAILQMIHSKKLPGLMVGGQWRIPKSALAKMISPSG